MGRPIGRLGDMNTGHGCFCPVPLAMGSPNVMVNGRPAGRVGDMYVPHCCPHAGCHPGTQMMGAKKVFVNGRLASSLGGRVSCGGVLMVGSSNVLVG